MAALNFPDHNLVTSYTNPDTGITYEWTNNSWKAVRTSQVSSGSGSQTLVSDTMPAPAGYEVGTLWWNSDSTDTSLYVLYQDPVGPNGDVGGKYWIEAAPAPDSIGFNGTHTGDSTFTGNMNVTGSATFAAAVTVGPGNPSNGNNDGTILYGSGGLGVSKSSGALITFNQTGSGSTGQINANGSATFASTVEVGEYSGGVQGVKLHNGYVEATNYQGNYNVFQGKLSGSETSSIKADGSAAFAGGVASDLYFEVKRPAGNSGDPAFQAFIGTDENVRINSDGSATFAGPQTLGTPSSPATNGYTSHVDNTEASTAACYSANNYNAHGINFLGVDGGNGNEITCKILNDGSVWFARGNFQMDTAGVIQTNLYSAGTLNIDSTGTFGNPKIVLNAANGSATFAGGVTFGGDCVIETGSINVYQAANSSTATVFNGGWNTGGGRNITSTIYSDGSATFAGTINGTTVGTSDIKFKENIEAAPAQLADIEAFELKTFDWKDKAPISDELKAQRKLGLIAQEVEAICPEMVYEVTGQDDDSYKAINHDVLIMKLLGAVKELSAKVAALEAN